MPGTPYGIDLSIDGTRIFAALNGSNAVAVVDIDQRTVSTIDLGVSTDHPTTYDVVEGEQNRLLMSANPGSSGLAYVAQVRLDQGNIASRVANEPFIRARPHLARSPDQQFVYVGSGFSPNSLYKLSLLDPNAQIVLEDDHGEVSGTSSLALSPDGARIYLRSGQVLATDTFTQVAEFPAGLSTVSADGTRLLVGDASTDSARVYSTATSGQTGNRRWGCDLLDLAALEEYGDGVLALGDDLVCYSRTVPYP